MQFSLNKKISDKTSQNKDLSQCDIAISQYHNVSKTHIAALAHIAFADRQKHRTIAFTMCPFREFATALQATSRNDIKCFARSGISDVAYSTLSVIEQSNAATNPYFVRNSRMIMKKIIY